MFTSFISGVCCTDQPSRRGLFGRAGMHFLLAVLLFAGPCVRASEPAFAHYASDVPADPEVRFGRLPNGIRYAIRHSTEPKGRASLRFGVLTGSFNEAMDQRGLAHFLEHLAFNGSTHFPPGTLVEYFQRLGMSFGGDTNAFTSFDRTEYLLELPDTKPETLEKAFMLFADYGDGLLLKPESIEKERGIILGEERARDSVDLRAWQAEMSFLLPEAIVPNRLPIGLKDVISQASRERFADYYDTWYRPENFVVVAVGDFDAAAVDAQLARALAGLHARAPARPKVELGRVVPFAGTKAVLHDDPDAPAVTIALDAIVPYAYERDTTARRLARLPRTLALSMLNRRLAILAKKEGAPFSRGEASVGEQFDFYRASSVELTCQPMQWREALGVAEQELRRALKYGFQPDELREAVAGFRNGLVQAANGAETRPAKDLADALITSIIDRKVFSAPEANLALYGPALDRVTPEDCQEALHAAWGESGRGIFISGNVTLTDPQKEILAAYAASETTEVTAPEKRNEVAFAYTDFGAAGKVKVRREVADLGISLLELQNGVRLNLKPTDFEAGRILVSVRVGGGRLTEPKDQPGLASTAKGTFVPGGLGKHSLDELQRILAGKTVNVDFAVDDDAFILAASTNKQDLLLQLQLLCAYLTDAGFRPEALRQYQKAIEQSYNKFAHTVEGPISTEVPRLMANGDTRFGLPPKETMQLRSIEEVKVWLTPQFANGSLEIALVGDLDSDAAIDAAMKTFGALPARGVTPAYTEERKVSFPATPLTQEFRVPTELERGLVFVAWPATDRRDAHIARRLQLLSAIFADRLRIKLREQLGGTYSPNAAANLTEAFPGYGVISAQAAIAPSRAQEMAEAIQSVATSLASDGVTDDELQRAKQPLLTSIHTSERRNSYWLANVLSAAQEQPIRLDWARERYADNAAIKKEDLDRLAKQYLAPGRASVFFSLPESPAASANIGTTK